MFITLVSLLIVPPLVIVTNILVYPMLIPFWILGRLGVEEAKQKMDYYNSKMSEINMMGLEIVKMALNIK